eukprot:TRINITY_DN7727_c0_g1_i1.p1 TRINITY_DN7727_c0_g1~~TRINITY_DN7727_c0_g1_i1.p1  ORF type:complete len:235 (-),score=10.96 TRINITY_DN7727_c0_g1_i1:84-788(-)
MLRRIRTRNLTKCKQTTSIVASNTYLFPKRINTLTSNQSQTRWYSDQLAKPIFRDNDWTCESCEFINFARRSYCFKCNTPNPKKSKAPIKYKNDWNCTICGFNNFARNETCFRKGCDGRKPVDALPITSDWVCNCGTSNSINSTHCVSCGKVNERPDWKCNECGFMNFRSRVECRQCETLRPEWTCFECQATNPLDVGFCQECDAERRMAWNCEICGYYNFAENTSCKSCNHVQ